MAGKVIIGCKLPHGIVLSHPQMPQKTVLIGGLNQSKIVGATHYETHVDQDFWDAWRKEHEHFPALKSGALFVARTQDEAAGKAKELANEKTGFDPLDQNAHGVTKDDGK